MHDLITQQLALQKITRKNIQQLMNAFSPDQWNTIPQGFSNNLIWNYGHVVVTHQLLVYGLSGLPMEAEDDLIDKYRKGTKPEGRVSEEEYERLRALFTHTPDQTLKDYQKGVFKSYKAYSTSFGASLNNVDEGIYFNNIHEAMHFGNMLSIRKFI